LGFVLVIVGCAIYWNSTTAPFAFDDDHAIVINEQIRHLSTSLAPTEQGSPLAGRPLVSLTFAINYALGGLNVRGYRLVNISIHVLNALLLFAIASRTLQGSGQTLQGAARTFQVRDLAFAVALIWMVHPLVTEPVDYISQRTELMMATCFLGTLYFAQRARGGSERTRPTIAGRRSDGGTRPPLPKDSSAWLGSSVACCALGMACKETMVVAPVVVLLYDRTFTFGSFREALRARLMPRSARRGSCWWRCSGLRRAATPPALRARRCRRGPTCSISRR
jgi:hypothetical protein